ncbi:MAG: hypothetical protein UY67_C0016G0018 [Candidatus Kaiserbacteria bacterium GW2011_GWA2_52_12]|uniref:Peptidase S74 domain-containing protein n=1 Tax=Candidatus Kaiserbacteria bacterium GW2011_GWA2_52_12 TaxID=1618671 RepID=A0A0G1WYK6_9BACT|nr:MAG: hypothetical protein UY67_C0016G0018 [Candidatus Kaiserbacteria bacterium GW2011_GWA2_52_12]
MDSTRGRRFRRAAAAYPHKLYPHKLGGRIGKDDKIYVSTTHASSFIQASSTRFSVFDKAYFGGTATSTFDSAGNLSITGTLGVTGATTLGNFTTTNGTTTNATSTNLAVTGTASTSNLIASTGFTFKTVTGFLKATAGAVAAALIDLTNDVTGILPVGSGGTGWANIASGAIPYGNGSSALTTTTAGTAGYVLAYLNGVPTWTATTTLANISGTLAVGSGGTGQTSFGQGWLNSDGTTLSASTSPTVNYIVATSTTATSTIASGGFTVGSSCLVVQQGSGNVGIGTTSPGSKLEVNGAVTIAGGGLLVKGNQISGAVFAGGTGQTAAIAGPATFFFDGTNISQGLYIKDISATNGAAPISFYSTTNLVGSVTQTPTNVAYNTSSDRRIKENIATTTLGLSTLMQIPVDDFDFITDPTHAKTTGFIAQKLLPIFPAAVTTNGDNGIDPLGASSTPWQVDYGRITPLIVKAVQDIANLSEAFKQTLIAWLADAANGITKFFAGEGHFADKLCVGDTCVTPAQFQAMVAAASNAGGDTSGTTDTNQQGDALLDTEPPVITINGNNPAHINVGDTYSLRPTTSTTSPPTPRATPQPPQERLSFAHLIQQMIQQNHLLGSSWRPQILSPRHRNPNRKLWKLRHQNLPLHLLRMHRRKSEPARRRLAGFSVY